MSHVIVKLTQGNINSNHIYLPSVIDFFPPSALGTGNVKTGKGQELELHYGLDKPIYTDIDGKKKFFRKRSWVKTFFTNYNIKAGDEVIIEHIDDYKFKLYLA